MSNKGEDEIDNYLTHLADRKYALYHNLYVATQQAYTSKESYKQIITIAKYEEILETINNLPNAEKQLVNKHFEELKF